MPIYEYVPAGSECCPFCENGFETIQGINAPSLEVCPKCSCAVVKAVSRPSLGASKSSFDDRAKAAGFSKLKRLGKGEYEKQY